ncbi:hypothetical protein E2C01_049470 [Portunus trituberculatus]|uniref:Uncharacterized protein n=1 Tax=Portunus trituberculatus TaxID=210409 RepID=A0A5B7G5N3_PORTR|nr:hypothetical protein [Portunus trituberculatus]
MRRDSSENIGRGKELLASREKKGIRRTFTNKEGHKADNAPAPPTHKSFWPAVVRFASREPSCCEAADLVVREGNELRGPECQRGGPRASREGATVAWMSF